jgi:Flp pilus assembly protein TadD
MSSLPSSGRFAARDLPRLLLLLRGEGYTGTLKLTRERVSKTVRFHGGDPVQAESTLAGEGLLGLLQDQGRLSAEAAAKAAQHAAEHGGKEEAALVALKLLGPRDLVMSLREASRRRILEAFGWPDGSFDLDREDAPPPESQALRVDALALVRDGLASRWTAEKLLADLGDKLGLHPVRGEGFTAAARRLAGEPAADALFGALDPDAAAWSALQGGGEPIAIATLWVLDAVGALAFRAPGGSEPDEEKEAPAATPPSASSDIEIVISGPGGSDPKPGGPRQSRKQKSASKAQRAQELREEVQEKHANFRQLDYYALLGIEKGAGHEQVKRAYLQAAKLYHPDALARLGLRIAKAHTVLTDPDQRASYEASLAGHEEIDAERLAQAETFYRKGDILMKMGNFSDALEMMRGAVQLWPEDSAYQSGLGWTLYKTHPPDLEKAREALEKAVALEAGDAVAHQRLAIVLRDLGDDAGAKREAATAKRLDPNVRA